MLVELKNTSEKLTSENYPYGFRLNTTKFDWIDFKPGFGFRHVSQTVNPKNGQLNKPKYSTYYDVMVLGTDDNNHVKSVSCDFYGDDGINKDCKFMFENFNLFSEPQIKHISTVLCMKLVASVKCQVIYCGSAFEDIKPFFDPSILIAKKMIATGENLFNEVNLDIEKIESFKIVGYQPFKVTHYKTI